MEHTCSACVRRPDPQILLYSCELSFGPHSSEVSKQGEVDRVNYNKTHCSNGSQDSHHCSKGTSRGGEQAAV
jgi:hypothetical protein